MASESTRQRRRGLPPSLHLRRHHHPQTGIQPQIPTTHATRRSRERFPRSLSNSSDSSISSSSSSSSSTSSSVSVEIQNSNNIGERTTALALLSLARKKNKTHRGRGRTRRRSSNPLQNNTNNYIHVSSSRRNRRKRRHPETKKELPFVWLFLRVAAVLFGVCYGTHCAFWMAHNHTNAIRRTFGLRAPRTTTGISTLDDDDNNNRADSSQDHPSGGAMAPSSAAATTIPQPDAIPPVRQQVKTASDPAVGAVVVVAPVFPLLQPQDSHPRTVAADASSKNSSTILVLNTLLRDRLRHDAFGIAERYASYIGSNKTMAAADNDGGDSNSAAGTAKNQALFWQTAAGLREKFASLYGGEKEARAMLIRGLTVFGQTKPFRTFTKNTKSRDDSEPKSSLHDDLQQTACRIHRARQSSHRTFRFAFGGYSVTAGRGNRFQQSFPLVMEQQLHTVFRLMDLNLIVKNAAMYVHKGS